MIANPEKKRKNARAKETALTFDSLVYLIEMEAYYRQNARAVYLTRSRSRWNQILTRIAWWKMTPREGFYCFEENAW